jgi:hypothetical protein
VESRLGKAEDRISKIVTAVSNAKTTISRLKNECAIKDSQIRSMLERIRTLSDCEAEVSRVGAKLKAKNAEVEALHTLVTIFGKEVAVVLDEMDFAYDGDLLTGRLLDAAEKNPRWPAHVSERYRYLLSVPRNTTQLSCADVCSALVCAAVDAWHGSPGMNKSATEMWLLHTCSSEGGAREVSPVIGFSPVIESLSIIYSTLAHMRAEASATVESLGLILQDTTPSRRATTKTRRGRMR